MCGARRPMPSGRCESHSALSLRGERPVAPLWRGMCSAQRRPIVEEVNTMENQFKNESGQAVSADEKPAQDVKAEPTEPRRLKIRTQIKAGLIQKHASPNYYW